jgi:hypothetical protein
MPEESRHVQRSRAFILACPHSRFDLLANGVSESTSTRDKLNLDILHTSYTV